MWVEVGNTSGGSRIEINQSQMDFLEKVTYHTLRKSL